MIVRLAETRDLKELYRLRLTVENQSHFMLFDPGERKYSEEAEKNFAARILHNKDLSQLVAEVDGKLCGFLGIFNEGVNKRRHSRTIALGVLEDHQGKGIGKKLIEAALEHCRNLKVLRVDLTVAATNTNAVTLYKMMGFEIEGIKQKAMLVNGVPTDELMMALLLETNDYKNDKGV